MQVDPNSLGNRYLEERVDVSSTFYMSLTSALASIGLGAPVDGGTENLAHVVIDRVLESLRAELQLRVMKTYSHLSMCLAFVRKCR